VRRVDQIEPLHLHLSKQRTTLDITITSELIQEFVDKVGEDSLPLDDQRRLSEWVPKAGDCVRLFLPLITQPKPFLVEFSARTQADAPVVILPRMLGSPISAAYVRALARNPKATLDSKDERPFLRLLTLVAYLNPYVLAETMSVFADMRSDGGNVVADASILSEWLQASAMEDVGLPPSEIASFSDHLATALVATREQLTIDLAIPAGLIEEEPALKVFPYLSDLTVASVGKFIQLFHQDIGVMKDKRSEENSGSARAQEIASELIDGAKALDKVLFDLKRADCVPEARAVASAVWSHAVRWTPYGVVDIELDKPSLVKISLVSNAGHGLWGKSERTLAWGRTPFGFSLPVGDASSTHVTVHLNDGEMRFDRKRKGIEFTTDANLDNRQVLRLAAIMLGSTSIVSEQIASFYDNTAARDVADDGVDPSRLILYLRLTQTTYWSYLIAAAGTVMSAVFIAYEWVQGLRGATGPKDVSLTGSISVVAITVALWLGGALPKRAIVHKKLVNLRFVLLIGALAILFTNVAASGALVIERHVLGWTPPGGGVHHRVPKVGGHHNKDAAK
jgi:hypothetical protein